MEWTVSGRAARIALRWLLLAGVIAGVLAMHILGGHDGHGGMASAPAPAAVGAPPIAVGDAPMAAMSMGESAMHPSPLPERNVAAPAIGQGAIAGAGAVAVDLLSTRGMGDDGMLGCILFLITVVLLTLGVGLRVRTGERRPGPRPLNRERARTAAAATGPPRISLCVARV